MGSLPRAGRVGALVRRSARGDRLPGRGIECWALEHYRGLKEEASASIELAARDLAAFAGR